MFKNKTDTLNNETSLNNSMMMLLALVIGVIGGFGALIFRDMIGLVHNLAFAGKFSALFDANKHTLVSIWGLGIIFVPVIGAVIVTWLTQTFAPEARGHGVPEVMDAIYYRDGKIRPIVAVIKSIASAISIGTGGSVGREGPIIQIGAAFSSFLGQIINMSTRQRCVLIAAGAAAGIAATFNTPIAGLAFAMELMLVSISAINVTIVSLATVMATMISHIIIGIYPSFYVPALMNPLPSALSPETIAPFIPFGILAGCAAAFFTHSIYWMEDRAEELVRNPYLRHMLGMLFLGIMLYAMMRFAGHYYVNGVGYSTILDILRGALTNPWFLMLLFACKLIATSLTIGTGASGGIFSPSLYLGATLGAAFAGVLNLLFPSLHVPAILFAITGMASMVSGTTGAVVTAIAITFEQTRDYADILPIMLTVAISYAVRVRITKDSIYTLKLYRRGRVIPQGLQASISAAKTAAHMLSDKFELVEKEQVNQWVQQKSSSRERLVGIVTENQQIIGVVRRELSYLISDMGADQLIDTKFLVVGASISWASLIRAMNKQGVGVALVSKKPDSKDPSAIMGIITPHEIMASSGKLAEMLD